MLQVIFIIINLSCILLLVSSCDWRPSTMTWGAVALNVFAIVVNATVLAARSVL